MSSPQQIPSDSTTPSLPPIRRFLESETGSFLKTIVIIIAALVFFRGSVLEPFKIPSGSMIPTLQISDQILVSKLSYGLRLPFIAHTLYQYDTPKRGDVVVFTRPDELSTHDDDESSINLIKRVVGLPGEILEVKDAAVFINGIALDEPYARWSEGGRESFGPVTIPAGHIILLGDNRDQSKDSRYWEDPFLEISRVKGRALVIYWTFDREFFSRLGKIIR
jgi:signal peptidase I